MARPTEAQSERLRLIFWAINRAHEELMSDDLGALDQIGEMREALTEAMNLIGPREAVHQHPA
jgi:hypothetical protein